MGLPYIFTQAAEPIDPAFFYCPHGHQWHECAACEETPEYRESDPWLYRTEEHHGHQG